jgi:hypothetical protein
MNENLLAALFLFIVFSPVIYQTVIVIREHKEERKIALKRFKLFLKFSLIGFAFLISIILTLSHTNYLNYESPMTFEKYDSITFENFRGIELFKKSLYGNKRFAYIVTCIDSKFEENSVQVEAVFHPARSFVYNQHNNSQELLTHEKYHFKITELYARKARREISKLTHFSKKKIQDILNKHRTLEDIFQKSYDFDTYHSYVYSQQKSYEQTIDSLFSLLSNFKKTTITFYEKD